ncbi:MAG: hypothetical protein H6732_00030 [Alphaproteobacteria bacterium]|nr:hypothetical protein [Alphaproteobacteria bacterium]
MATRTRSAPDALLDAHVAAVAVIRAEALQAWLDDPAQAVAGSWILPDGRAFTPTCLTWAVEPAGGGGWTHRCTREGWQLTEAGALEQALGAHVLELLWCSGRRAGGLAHGRALTAAQRARFRRAVGDARMDALERLPRRGQTIWDRWAAEEDAGRT